MKCGEGELDEGRRAGGSGRRYCSFFSDSGASSLGLSSSGCVSSYLRRKKKRWNQGGAPESSQTDQHLPGLHPLPAFQNKSVAYSTFVQMSTASQMLVDCFWVCVGFCREEKEEKNTLLDQIPKLSLKGSESRVEGQNQGRIEGSGLTSVVLCVH